MNTIEQLFLLDQLEVCLPHSRLLTGIPILMVIQNLGWNSNKTCLLSKWNKFVNLQWKFVFVVIIIWLFVDIWFQNYIREEDERKWNYLLVSLINVAIYDSVPRKWEKVRQNKCINNKAKKT